MKLKKIKLLELKEPYDFSNYNKHPQSQIDELKKSLEKFLQYKNIVLWKDNQVIAGNGLVEAARQLGWDEIYVNDRSDLDKESAVSLLISDNILPTLSITDDNEFQSLINQLETMDIPGYINDGSNPEDKIITKNIVPYKAIHFLISVNIDNNEAIFKIQKFLLDNNDIKYIQGSN